MLLLLLTTGIGEMALSENRLAPNPVVDYHFLLSKCIDIYIYTYRMGPPVDSVQLV